MRRILIVGNSGGGKSTLARALGERLGLPVIHLDALYWKPGWTPTDDAEFRPAVTAAVAAPAWICDGNFSGTWDLRMPRADTIVWIDQPRVVCLARAIARVFRSGRGTRPDMAEGCHERLDPSFWSFIWSYDRRVKPTLEAALAELGAHAQLVRLRGDRDIAAWLSRLPAATSRAAAS